MLEPPEFQAAFVDMERFYLTPCCGFVLQFLILANDVDALVELNRMRKRPSNEGPNFFSNMWARGALTYLQRQNISIVFECLDATVSTSFAKVLRCGQGGTVRPRLLWTLIKQDQSLMTKLQKLENFRNSPAYRVMDAVRDKLGAHADRSALRAGLRSVLDAGDSNYGVFAKSSNGQFRAFFADDILVEHNIQLSIRADIGEVFPELFGAVRQHLVEFAVELLEKFCEENDLFASSEESDRMFDTIKSMSSFRFL
jgi:hypothetical protein